MNFTKTWFYYCLFDNKCLLQIQQNSSAARDLRTLALYKWRHVETESEQTSWSLSVSLTSLLQSVRSPVFHALCRQNVHCTHILAVTDQVRQNKPFDHGNRSPCLTACTKSTVCLWHSQSLVRPPKPRFAWEKKLAEFLTWRGCASTKKLSSILASNGLDKK